MATRTIRLPDETHERLKQLAAARGISVNKLFERFSTQAISEADAFTRFKLHSASGNISEGLKILDKLDKHFSEQK